ncbi:MAG: SDR family NAD(P)-dependent oxidoreductase [Actinomycetia bacterium]|nr:SDR family NAD(P)-dependent oxidoreductase [Actinomycetes bacterium]
MSGNTVVITGGATGIGYAMAEYFLARDNVVVICGRRADRLAQAAERLPGAHTMECDVTSPVGRERLIEFTRERFPNVNILINNAGAQRDIDLTKGVAELDDGDSEIAVNLEAPIWLSAMFLPLLRGKDNATIAHVSSGLAFMVERATRCPIYCATKAAVHAFAIAQRIQLAPAGVRVVEIIPPAVESELNLASRRKRNFVTAPNMLTADEFVAAALGQMEQDVDEIRVPMKWAEHK